MLTHRLKALNVCLTIMLCGFISPMVSAETTIDAKQKAEANTFLTETTNKNDPDLVQALQQATHDTQDNTIDLDYLVWLADMSEKITKRVPNAFYRIRLLETVHQEAKAQGLDPLLVLAVMDVESNFNRYAESFVGAQGLMQVMPFWKKEYGHPDDDLFNPKVNIRYGCKILRHYLDRYKKPVKALAAYNGSIGKSKYPDKVYRRIANQWNFKEDTYSRKTENEVVLVK